MRHFEDEQEQQIFGLCYKLIAQGKPDEIADQLRDFRPRYGVERIKCVVRDAMAYVMRDGKLHCVGRTKLTK